MDESYVEGRIARIKSSVKEANNAKIIASYDEYNRAFGLRPVTRLAQLATVCRFEKNLGKSFRKATKQDIIDYLNSLVNRSNGKPYKENTLTQEKFYLKKFYRWLLNPGAEEYPDIVKWMKPPKRVEKLPIDKLLTEKDIRDMIEATDHPRDKALISVLYESGCRLGEIVDLKIENVNFDEYGATFIIPRGRGKTGERRLRLINSVPYLRTWLENHPNHDDPNAHLWVRIRTGRYEPLGYWGIEEAVKRVAKQANKKNITPHKLRHARLTRLAKMGFNETELRIIAGWADNSRMPSVYLHISGKDVDDKLLRLHGILKEKDEIEEGALKPRVCPRCRHTNESTARFCAQCSLALDLKTAIDFEKKMAKADEQLARLLGDDKVQKFLVQRLRELGIAGSE